MIEVTFKMRRWLNAVESKWPNRRVRVYKATDGIIIEFRKHEPSEAHIEASSNQFKRGPYRVTSVKISDEASFALYQALGEHFRQPLVPMQKSAKKA